MKKIFLIFVIIIMSFCFSACNDFETPLSLEQVRESVFSCFSEHNEAMLDIVTHNLATGETDWCKVYNLLTDGQYEFVLYRWGFTGTNISAGILFLPDDIPDEKFIQDANNSICKYCLLNPKNRVGSKSSTSINDSYTQSY